MADTGSLDLENLISPEELFSFSGGAVGSEEPEENKNAEKQTTKEEKTPNITDGGDGSDLFDAEPNQESVGDGGESQAREDADDTSRGSSPKNIYSSIAKDFKDDDIFPELEDDEIGNIKTAEDLSNLINSQIEKRLSDTEKRINDALNAGLEPTDIQRYEQTINFLDNITEEQLTNEDDAGADLRQRLIYQDLVNRGYSEERARRAVQKSIDSGNDIDDAKDALEGNKEYYKKQYNDIVKEAKANADAAEREVKKNVEKLQKSIMDGDAVFGDFVVPKAMRQSVIDAISKPVYRDPETGKRYTAIQKFDNDNHYEFMKILGTVYAMTDGFKTLDKLIGDKVAKKTKKSLSNLTDAINSTTRNSDGSFRYVSGGGDGSYSGADDWTLDV